MNETSSNNKPNKLQQLPQQSTLSRSLTELGIPGSWIAYTGEPATFILEMGHIVEHLGMLFKGINRDITDYAIFHESPQLKQLVFIICKHLLAEYSQSIKNTAIATGGDIEFAENCAPVVTSVAEGLGIIESDLGYDLTASVIHTTEMAFISMLDASVQGLLSQNRLMITDFLHHTDFAESNHFTCILHGIIRSTPPDEGTAGLFT